MKKYTPYLIVIALLCVASYVPTWDNLSVISPLRGDKLEWDGTKWVNVRTNILWVTKNNCLLYRNSTPEQNSDFFDNNFGHEVTEIFVPRWAKCFYDNTGNFNIYYQTISAATGGKTNCVIRQYYTTTNVSRNTIQHAINYRSWDKLVQVSVGSISTSYDQLTSGTNSWTNSVIVSLPPNCTNGVIEVLMGRALTFSPTNSIWWIASQLEWYN